MEKVDFRHHIERPALRQSCAAQNLKRFQCNAQSAKIFGTSRIRLNLPQSQRQFSGPVDVT
jgi:hypothetical protein